MKLTFLSITVELLKFHKKNLKKYYLIFRNFSKITFFQIKRLVGKCPLSSKIFFVVKHENRFPEQVESLSGLFGSRFMKIQCFNLVESKLGTRVYQDHSVSTHVQVEEFAQLIGNFARKNIQVSSFRCDY